ncbi:MAG: ABC transporter permease [Thaumarchaeota archaeon]|nr:ABC transporter permease [Nitrososphaerota archaeon]
MRARALVRLWSVFGEPLWIVVSMGFPVLSSLALFLLYYSIGATAYVGFAILGGVMVAFWGNVLWSMASQFNWDKQEGLFEIYLTSPASISAILIGMSVGGIIGTLPSSIIVVGMGWLLASLLHITIPVAGSWLAVGLTFALTLASLYAMGMALSSLYLVYGREAESMNEVLQEPVSMLSGIYFPSFGVGSPFPFALQAVASLIPLTIGMYTLRQTLFPSGSGDVLVSVLPNLAELAVMAVVFLALSSISLKALENKGRRDGTISVRIR